MSRRGKEIGLPEESRRKNEDVRRAGLKSLELARTAGVEIGFGTDLLGPLHEEQSGEFLIRYDEGDGESPSEIIRSATWINARLLRREGQLGEVVPHACADLLVVDGDPLKDLKLLQDQGAHLAAIMKGGRFYKNRLTG
jgi:imidazolonepropionase-like amidohydrolase